MPHPPPGPDGPERGADDPGPLLSKSRYVSGLQCHKRLWLEVRRPELALPGPAQVAALAAGAHVGERARLLFPGGVLVEETDFDAARARTRALLADPSVPALFEAAFAHRGVRIRADVLQRRRGGAFRLIEVKAASSAKDIHIHDLAVQQFVLHGAGVVVEGCDLLHVNPHYVRAQAGIHWPSLFQRSDLTAAVAARLGEVGARVEDLLRVAASSGQPPIEPGSQCRSPYECPFLRHCTAGFPADWIGRLPHLSRHKRSLLRGLGVLRIGEIPDVFPLGPAQRRAREVLRGEAPALAPALHGALERAAAAGPPAAALDFEAMTPALPLYPGTRPYQAIPFQWSLHPLARGAAPSGFLADPAVGDPRRAFAASLLAATDDAAAGGPEGAPILVYSGYESSALASLAQALPDLAEALEALRRRLLDLLPLVRTHVYHPAFAGSYSLKRVAPALVAGLTYDDLAEAEGVADGAQAGAAFERMVRRETPAEEALALRAALVSYCARDTLALARLYEALRRGDASPLPPVRR